ncbi:MAG: hypothetical protein DRP64_19885 [Verrucomicrobia bacterium]|nr:MAG: hypothetical protein DRP64_19885 [Verrucomicrobiota bacterium]
MVAYNYDDMFVAIYDATGEAYSTIDEVLFPPAPVSGLVFFSAEEGWLNYWCCKQGILGRRHHDERIFLVDSDDLHMYELNPMKTDVGEENFFYETVDWQTKEFLFERPLNFSALQIQAKEYPVMVQVWADKQRVYYQEVLNEEPVRLPSGFLAREWAVRVSTKSYVYRISVADSIRELSFAEKGQNESP